VLFGFGPWDVGRLTIADFDRYAAAVDQVRAQRAEGR